MPHWVLYHPASVFQSGEERRALSQDITTMYTSVGLPAIFVVVNFIKLEPNDTWVGGEKRTTTPFIRITIDHIAVKQPDDDVQYRRVTTRIDQALKPYIEDKGYDWEYHVAETERRLWKINGLVPPARNSDEERLWAKENRAVEYPGSKV